MYKKLTNQPTLFNALLLLFFIWGFITLLNDLLIPTLRAKLHLNYAQAMLVQFCFFLTYFLMGAPTAWILNKFGYKKSILLGLIVISLGCLFFIPAELTLVYGIFLLGLFVLAAGIVILQTSANPLVVLLGNSMTSPARLNLAQGMNSLGTVVAPILVGAFIVKENIAIPYIIIAIVVVLVALFMAHFNFRVVDDKLRKEIATKTTSFPLWRHASFVLGLISLFVYVGAEVAAGSLIVNFLQLPHIAHFTIAQGVRYLPVYWGGAMFGRLLASYILTKIDPPKVVIFNAVANVLLLAGVIFTTGYIAMWSLLLIGFFNSVMFPTIFALAINDLPTERIKNKASGFLVMAIVGGAIIPELQGLLADYSGLQWSFTLLFICYLIIMSYGIYKAQVTAAIPRD